MKKIDKSILSALVLVVLFAAWLIVQRTGLLSGRAATPLVELPDDQLELPASRPGDRIRGKQAMREDYWGSGWTRGHMAPAGDFMWDDEAMAETFFFMNICPQREELNNKDWQYLEKQVRAWARKYGKVWVVSGPIVGDNIYGTIGKDHVIVPDAFYKVVLVHDGRRYQSIAFVMGNDAERYWLQDCALTVDELEKRTGLDFYPALPDDLENDTESRYDFSVWGIRSR